MSKQMLRVLRRARCKRVLWGITYCPTKCEKKVISKIEKENNDGLRSV